MWATLGIIGSIIFIVSSYLSYRMFKNEMNNKQKYDKRVWQIAGFVVIISFFVGLYGLSAFWQYH